MIRLPNDEEIVCFMATVLKGMVVLFLFAMGLMLSPIWLPFWLLGKILELSGLWKNAEVDSFEGRVCKGGRNLRPSTPRPSIAPVAQKPNP